MLFSTLFLELTRRQTEVPPSPIHLCQALPTGCCGPAILLLISLSLQVAIAGSRGTVKERKGNPKKAHIAAFRNSIPLKGIINKLRVTNKEAAYSVSMAHNYHSTATPDAVHVRQV